MADWTKATLAERALEYLGVKDANQDGDAKDDARAQEVIESVHAQLQGEDLAPFLVSAIPTWAQQSMVKIIAGELGPEFGRPDLVGGSRVGRDELQTQMNAGDRETHTRAKFY